MKKIDIRTQTKTGKPRQRSAPITRQQYYRTRAEIKLWDGADAYDPARIGKNVGLGISSVRLIKQSRSWPHFQAMKQERMLRRQRAAQIRKPRVTNSGVGFNALPPLEELREADYRMARDLQKYVIEQREQRHESSRQARRVFVWLLLAMIAVIWATVVMLYVVHAR